MGCHKKINFVIAHAMEAKPVVDYYRLELNTSHHAFKIFDSPEVQLIISGQGQINAAAATAYLAAVSKAEADQSLWINLGVAGHPQAQVGSLWRAQKVSNNLDKRQHYPVNLCKKSKLNCADLVTVTTPCRDYHEPVLYDMEASGFFSCAKRFTTLEFIHSFKIVSDNKQNPIDQFDNKNVSALICPQLDEIDSYISELKEYLINNISNSMQNIDLKEIYLTHSQRLIIQALSQSVLVHGQNPQLLIDDCDSADEIINSLQQTLSSVELKI